MEEAAAETGSPSIQLSAEPGSEAAACFSWRDGWEVLRFFSSLFVTFQRTSGLVWKPKKKTKKEKKTKKKKRGTPTSCWPSTEDS